MGRWLKRVLVMLLIGGSSAAAVRAARRRAMLGDATAPEPQWPAFEPVGEPVTEPVTEPVAEPVVEPPPAPATPPADSPDWLPPIDGTCPPGYPIKANDNSRIYHVPGGRFYDKPTPERCYATEAAAQRDGYRRAKH